jgi:hypothetical protein
MPYAPDRSNRNKNKNVVMYWYFHKNVYDSLLHV